MASTPAPIGYKARMRASKGMRFQATVVLTADEVARFARSVGDDNPLHHDKAVALASPYRQCIASGPHTSALMMATTASHFSRGGAMVGLEFGFRFRRAVPADQTVRIEWLVVGVRAHARLGGEIVDLRGRLQTEDGTTAVGAWGRVLLR